MFKDGSEGECTQEEVCQGDLVQSWHVDQDSPASLDNFITQMDMYCSPKSYIGLMGSLLFLGITLSMLILPAASDKFGRVTVLRFVQICYVPLLYVLASQRYLAAVYFFFFFSGFFGGGRVLCGFIYLTEVMPEKH